MQILEEQERRFSMAIELPGFARDYAAVIESRDRPEIKEFASTDVRAGARDFFRDDERFNHLIWSRNLDESITRK